MTDTSENGNYINFPESYEKTLWFTKGKSGR